MIEQKLSINNGGEFQGYGSVFGNIDSHGDIVAKGAFAETLKEAEQSGKMPAMYLQHASGPLTWDQMPIGIWTNMKEDDTGLYVEGKLALDTQYGREAHALLVMKPRPALSGLSIGYRATKFRIHNKGDKARRTLQAVKLFEVSLVSDPSNDLARIKRVKSSDVDSFSRALAELAAAVRA